MQQSRHSELPDFSHIVHTSGYARVQHSSIGATSTETFEQRRATDRLRQHVQRYDATVTARQVQTPRRSALKPDFSQPPTLPTAAAPTRSNDGTPPQPSRHRFTEPPSRRPQPQ